MTGISCFAFYLFSHSTLVMKKINILVYAVMLHACAYSQHSFTQYYSSPLLINPANTGKSIEDYRAGGFFRSEKNSYEMVNTSASFFYDTRIMASRIPENDRLSFGIAALSEKNVFAGIKNNYFRLSLAYQKSLDESGLQYLSIGFQGGFSHKKIEPPVYVFEDQLIAWSSAGFKGLGPGQSNIIDINYADINAGINFQVLIGEKNLLSLGFSTSHINSPYVVFDGGAYSESPSLGFQAGLETMLPNSSKLYSSFLISKTKQEIDNLTLGSLYMMKLNSKNYHMGGGIIYRQDNVTGTVIAPCLSLKYNSFLLHLSYDIPASSSVTTPRSGLELGMIFSGKRKKSK